MAVRGGHGGSLPPWEIVQDFRKERNKRYAPVSLVGCVFSGATVGASTGGSHPIFLLYSVPYALKSDSAPSTSSCLDFHVFRAFSCRVPPTDRESARPGFDSAEEIKFIKISKLMRDSSATKHSS